MIILVNFPYFKFISYMQWFLFYINYHFRLLKYKNINIFVFIMNNIIFILNNNIHFT